MNWYRGNIEEAVTLSKARNAVFVVYVDGTDENSKKLRDFMDEEKVKFHLESEDFVAIKITSGSEAYVQFVQIYRVVPVPSLFFIGKNGAPLEIITGIVKSVEELVSKINNVLINPKKLIKAGSSSKEESTSQQNSNQGIASANLISNEQLERNNSNIARENGVCRRGLEKKEASEKEILKKKEIPNKKYVPEKKELSEEWEIAEKKEQEKIVEFEKKEEFDRTAQSNKSKKIIEEKLKEREAEETRAKRERELQRKKERQDVQNLKRWQKERDLQQLKENLRREQLEEQIAKQQILKKIASDRAEQEQKFCVLNPGTVVNQSKDNQRKKLASIQGHLQNDPGTSRIQFRKPDGESVTNTFNSSDKFQMVREYVKMAVLPGSGIKEFALATTFPKKEFTLEDDKEVLFDLGLCPNAVLLVLTTAGLTSGPFAIVTRSGGFINVFKSIVSGVLSPFLAAFKLLKCLIVGKSARTSGSQKLSKQSSNDDANKRRNIARVTGNGVVSDEASTSFGIKRKENVTYRRIGNSNIHRLHDDRSSDDENNTWNGNSTQQQ